LETDEREALIDSVEDGSTLTDREASYEHSQGLGIRDMAMITLLLGTGIRISECVGMDLNDVDFERKSFRITRKGGDVAVLYFSDEVAEPLKAYYDWRVEHGDPLPGHEQALFLSLQRKRVTARAVENRVKKYAMRVTPLKHITPHKLRSTYGTDLYRQTGDIYLVADVLGHKDVNTTRRHYAQLEDARRREAAKYVKLRSEDDETEGNDEPPKSE
jgi:site-specific recombinase XerD